MTFVLEGRGNLMRTRIRLGGLAAGWLLASGVGITPVVGQNAYEKPPVLRAADLAPADLLKGPHFQVDERVPTDGLLARFTIKSDFGPFEAQGPGMLAERVAEIRAIDILSRVEKTDVFKKALGETAKRTGKSLATAVAHPVETIEKLPEGVGRFFERVSRGVKTGAQKASDYMSEKSGQPGGSSASDVATVAGQAGSDVGESVIGYDDARRRVAKEVKVDPYTTNAVLSKKLDDVAWAAWSGEFGLGAAVSLVPGGSAVMFTKNWVSDLVWDVGPGDLRVRMDKNLQGMGVSQDVIDQFLRQRHYILTIQLFLTEALATLPPGAGRAAVIPWALTAESENQARFMAGSVGILADYNRNAAPIARLRIAGPLVGDTQNGGLVVAAPVDYIPWTERVAAFTSRPEVTAAPERHLWLTGRLSPRAREELTARGWSIREGVASGIVRAGGGEAGKK
jgi:hypothetical protein